MEYDMVKRLQMRVPMTNYAVGLQMPNLWDALFRSYTFRLKSGGRTVVIKQGERAYFDVADGGFSYSLSATNTTHQQPFCHQLHRHRCRKALYPVLSLRLRC